MALELGQIHDLAYTTEGHRLPQPGGQSSSKSGEAIINYKKAALVSF